MGFEYGVWGVHRHEAELPKAHSIDVLVSFGKALPLTKLISVVQVQPELNTADLHVLVEYSHSFIHSSIK